MRQILLMAAALLAAPAALASAKDDFAAAQAADQIGDHATAILLYTNALTSDALIATERADAYRGVLSMNEISANSTKRLPTRLKPSS